MPKGANLGAHLGQQCLVAYLGEYLGRISALELLHETVAPLLSSRLAEAARVLRRDLLNNSAQVAAMSSPYYFI